jgi:hypothetical protein
VPSTLAVSWTADDLDGDPLTAAVDFSTDGGETWEPKGMGIEGFQTELDTSLWQQTEHGMLRVMVTDGVNTGQDVTGPFTVTAKAPVVFAIAPEDGGTVPAGIPVLLTATGYDAEDGPMEGDAVAWSSDRDGALGTSDQLVVTELSPGWHEITVTATDSDDNTATDAVRLYVGYRTYLPMLLRASQANASSPPGPGGRGGPRSDAAAIVGILLTSLGLLGYLGTRRQED